MWLARSQVNFFTRRRKRRIDSIDRLVKAVWTIDTWWSKCFGIQIIPCYLEFCHGSPQLSYVCFNLCCSLLLTCCDWFWLNWNLRLLSLWLPCFVYLCCHYDWISTPIKLANGDSHSYYGLKSIMIIYILLMLLILWFQYYDLKLSSYFLLC